MRKKNIYILIVISILNITSSTFGLQIVKGQIIDNGQSHYSIKWNQINTKNYRLIFPSSFSKEASILSKIIDYFIRQTSEQLGIKPKKISIILESNHIEQNGFVQLAPRKSEVYPVPSGISTNEEWLPNLLIHELRHVAQFDKLTGLFNKPFFEQLGFALFGLHLPSWFFEGDAVETETLLTLGGRGRLPSWDMPIRANLQGEKDFTFDKYLMGSYKDIVPSFYTIGYLMTNHLTNEKGIQIKEKILDNMSKNLLRPFNFNKSLKKFYGYNSAQLYKNTIDTLKNKWKDESLKPKIGKSNIIHLVETGHCKYPANYIHPQKNERKQLFYILSSPQKRNRIVSWEKEREKDILELGPQLAPYFHIQNNKIVWDEYHKDARYSKTTYSTLHTYDIHSKSRKKLTHKTRYYTPVFHPIKDEIVAVCVDPDNQSTLVSISASTGTLLDTLFKKEGLHIQQPSFNKKGDKIVFIGINHKGTNLFELNVSTKNASPLLEWGNQQLEKPQYYGDKIIFKAHYTGRDQIHLLSDNGIFTLTNATNGAFYPHVYENELLFSDYRTTGYKVAIAELDSLLHHKRLTIQKDNFVFSQKDKASPLDTSFITHQSSETPPRIQKYNSLSHLFNFHSLSLSSNNFENLDNFNPGIFWYANDLLNTSQIKLGYEYDTDIGESKYSAEFLYQKFPAIISLNYENRGQMSHVTVENQIRKDLIKVDWREHIYNLDIRLPFSVFHQNFIHSYGANIGTSYIKRYNLSLSNISNFRHKVPFPLNYQVYYNRNRMLSKMDLAPKWGQNVSITYRHTPFGGLPSSNLLSIRSGLYFPGILTNHSFRARYSIQFTDGLYSISNDIPLPTGFEFIDPINIKNTLLTEYRFPFAYPDWNLGAISYIKRFQALLFSDFHNVEKSRFSPTSYGAGLYADAHFFRFPAPAFTFGIKLAKMNTAISSKSFATFYNFTYTY